jgi:hypothetical protein
LSFCSLQLLVVWKSTVNPWGTLWRAADPRSMSKAILKPSSSPPSTYLKLMQAVAVLGADHQESRVIFVKMCENAETTPSENIIR